MRIIGSILVLVVLAVIANAQLSAVTIADFSEMAGCWEREEKSKNLLVTEQWMKPAGTSILGMGRTVKNGKTVDHEFMRIEQRTDGIYFVAKPKANESETAFKLKSFSAKEAVFENPEHDFPQRVIYRIGATKMVGRIEGDRNGKPAGIDFPFEKVNCG